jgi:hypothetical protein
MLLMFLHRLLIIIITKPITRRRRSRWRIVPAVPGRTLATTEAWHLLQRRPCHHHIVLHRNNVDLTVSELFPNDEVGLYIGCVQSKFGGQSQFFSRKKSVRIFL